MAAALPEESSTWISNFAPVQLHDAERIASRPLKVNCDVVVETFPVKTLGVGVEGVEATLKVVGGENATTGVFDELRAL